MKLKKTLLSVLACVLSLVFVFAFTACGDKEKDPVPTAVTVDKTTAEVAVDESVKLNAKVKYSDESNKDNPDGVEWSSSSTEIATVSTKGNVVGKSHGTATITAKIGDYTASCTVTVYELVVEISDATASIEKGATKNLTASVKKNGTAVADAQIEWSSSNETVATVDANGKVTAWSDGSATITAKRAGGNQSATCAVTVTWANKPASYKEISFGEQNKLAPNEWAYWNAQEGWGQGQATAYEAYTEDYETGKTPAQGYQYIGVNKATFDYKVTEPFASHTYQIFYRSSNNVEGGLLEYNHVYEVKFKVDSNVAGTIKVNPYDDARPKGADESQEDYDAYIDGLIAAGTLTEHEIAIVAGTTNISVKFRHDDCGYKFQDGIYDNMGSALHLQLADLAGRVQFSIYDVQFKDLGAAQYPVEDDESKHAGNATDEPAPTHPADPAVMPASTVTLTGVTLTAEGEKAIFNLAGTVDLTKFDNAEAAKTWLTATHFDLQDCGGSWVSHAFERLNVTVNNDGTFAIKYDITYLAVQNGFAYTGHFCEKESSEAGYSDNKYRDIKLDAEKAVHGASVTVGGKTYAISNVVDGTDQTTNWGCVSIKVTAAE